MGKFYRVKIKTAICITKCGGLGVTDITEIIEKQVTWANEHFRH